MIENIATINQPSDDTQFKILPARDYYSLAEIFNGSPVKPTNTFGFVRHI